MQNLIAFCRALGVSFFGQTRLELLPIG